MEKIVRAMKVIILIMVALATFYFVFLIRAVLLPFLIGALLAYVIHPAVRAAGRYGIPRTYAILTIYLFTFAALFAFSWFVVPGLLIELSQLAHNVPGYIDGVHRAVADMNGTHLPVSVHDVLLDGLNRAERSMYLAFRHFLSSLTALLGSLITVVFAPIIAYYLLTDWERIRDGFLSLFTPSGRRQAVKLGGEINRVIGGYIQGHLIVCAIVGALSGLAAALLGIKYALLIGLINGLAELLPYFGPFIGIIPAGLLAVQYGSDKAIYLVIALVLIQQLESNILSPRIVGDKVGLHPIAVMLSLLAGAELWGVWGMLFAVPAAAVLVVLIRFAFYRVVD